jgi:alpha-mannosidase
LVRSMLLFEAAEGGLVGENGKSWPEAGTQAFPEPSFVADGWEVLGRYARKFSQEHFLSIEQRIGQLDWSLVGDRPAFDLHLADISRQLLPDCDLLQARKISLLGHAHLDLAWLWPVEETWVAAERTFESVLALQAEFSELTFTHSTPALYEWIEQHRPELFTRIQDAVRAGVWEPLGGIWVEPELNLVSGESLARQLLYGQRYYQAKFGQTNAIAWLPDCFGFNAQLPQLLRQGGIDTFVTQKLLWNDTTAFPHGLFKWRSPDGSEVVALMSAPIGEGIDPVKMADHAIAWEGQTGQVDALWLPGVGDHGGGPTRDMLNLARRWSQSPFFPRLEFTTAAKYLEAIGSGPKGPKAPSDVPVWNSELYLEFHRGCYTSHADQKWWNRQCEALLYDAELLAVLASLTVGVSYPHIELEQAWKGVLFNQFHDILPGSSIPEVFEDANKRWRKSQKLALQVLNQSKDALLGAVAANLSQTRSNRDGVNEQLLLVFNPLPWQRRAVVEVLLPVSAAIAAVSTGGGEPVAFESKGAGMWVIEAAALPGIGYASFWLELTAVGRARQPKAEPSEAVDPGLMVTQWLDQLIANQPYPDEGDEGAIAFDATGLGDAAPAQAKEDLTQGDFTQGAIANQTIANQIDPDFLRASVASQVHSATSEVQEGVATMDLDSWKLENQLLQVWVDPATGNLARVYDRRHQRQVLAAAGNVLQAFRDEGQYWDAWNIDPNYAQHPLPVAMEEIRWVERGQLRSRLQVIRRVGRSRIIQDYVLEANSPLLKIETYAEWQERHTLLKAAFPTTITADEAWYEIPAGAIARPTRPQTPAEQAQWEVPALGWAALNDGNYGAAILADCKHGYDATPTQLRLTLLRGSTWPDPRADWGDHSFTYALLPHSGGWQSVVRPAAELNSRLHLFEMSATALAQGLNAPGIPVPTQSWLSLGAENLHLMSLKRSETDPQAWILRCCETQGKPAQLKLSGALNWQLVQGVDILERSWEKISMVEGTAAIAPWQVATFLVVLKPEAT